MAEPDEPDKIWDEYDWERILQQQDRKTYEEPAFAEPVDVYIFEYLNHLNAKRLDAFPFASKQPDKNRPRNINCREQIDQQAQHQRDRKSANRSGAKNIEKQRRDDRGHVRIDDRNERMAESLFDRRGYGLA